MTVEKDLKSREGASINRVIYVVSDMRQRDWPTKDVAGDSDQTSVNSTLKRIGSEAAGCFLVDVGREDDLGNLLVEEVRPEEKALVSGVNCRFGVKVRNAGKRDVNDVKVRFTSAGSIPLEVDVPTLAAGQAETVPFSYTFARPESPTEDARREPVPIRVEVVPPATPGADELQADDTRYFAARVVPGIKTLIVDGDPSAEYGRSESFFLNRALAPPGRSLSGVSVNVVTDVEFETVRLDDYQVIYLCNLYRIPEERRQALERWVNAGGGLVIALGDQLDEVVYNRELYRGGKGLLPLELNKSEGDEEEQHWLNFSVQSKTHPVMKAFRDGGNLFTDAVKIFRWWDCKVDADAVKAGTVSVVATLSDDQHTPAVVDKAFGEGRVLVFTTPLDLDWSDWPQDASYPLTMLILNSYMARKTADEANVSVGTELEQTLDLTHYDLDVALKRPDEKTIPLQANPADQAGGDQVLYRVTYDDTDKQGFYEMVLNRRDGAAQPVLFAANVDPREGDLARADTAELMRRLGDANVKLVSGTGLLEGSVDRAKSDLLRYVFGALLIALCAEQFLGWWFGRRR